MCLFEEVCVCVTVCVNPVSVSTNLSLLPVWSLTPLTSNLTILLPTKHSAPLCVFICLWVFWINISKYCSKQSVPHTECVHSRWITFKLPLPLLLSPEKGSTQTHLEQKSMHPWASEDILPSLYLTISNNLLCVQKLFLTMFYDTF